MMAETPVRHIRIDDELWRLAVEKAERRRETVATVVRRLLLAYVEEESLTPTVPPTEGDTDA
jgi:hypothetical protein